MPILQKNIPKALGADKGLIELVVDEFEALPMRLKQMQNALQKLSEDELRVHINQRQLEWLEGKYKRELKRERVGWISIILAIIILLNGVASKVLAYTIFGFGVMVLIW